MVDTGDFADFGTTLAYLVLVLYSSGMLHVLICCMHLHGRLSHMQENSEFSIGTCRFIPGNAFPASALH